MSGSSNQRKEAADRQSMPVGKSCVIRVKLDKSGWYQEAGMSVSEKTV